jgi:hypothetical protein
MASPAQTAFVNTVPLPSITNDPDPNGFIAPGNALIALDPNDPAAVQQPVGNAIDAVAGQEENPMDSVTAQLAVGKRVRITSQAQWNAMSPHEKEVVRAAMATGGQLRSSDAVRIYQDSVKRSRANQVQTVTTSDGRKVDMVNNQIVNSPEIQARLENAKLDLQKSQAEVAQMESRKQAASSEISNMRQMLAELKSHPGMSTSVGAKGPEYFFGIKKEPISGTRAADFYTLLEQVQGGTFMQAFNNLKGGGQITEQEGAKATAAIARLNPRQTEEGFNKALMDFDGILAQAQARSQANAPQASAANAAQAAPAQPQQPATRVIGGRTFIQQPNGNWIPR